MQCWLKIFDEILHTLKQIFHLLNLNKNQIESIASLVYNIGQGRFKNSKAYDNLLKGDLEGFKKEAFDSKEGFVKDKKGGKIIEGLVTRRQEEKKLFVRYWRGGRRFRKPSVLTARNIMV